MIVNQIHLVSTPLDTDYKNVYDGVNNKRSLRSFYISKFANKLVCNKSTNTSIRFEKELMITLNIPVNDGINSFYNDLRKYNYMIITATNTKKSDKDYYNVFFYFVTDIVTENSVSNSYAIVPDGLTQGQEYITVTFKLEWDVWSNNIEELTTNNYDCYIKRCHIVNERTDGNDKVCDNIYEKNPITPTTKLREVAYKRLANRKTLTCVYLKVLLDDSFNFEKIPLRQIRNKDSSSAPVTNSLKYSNVYNGCLNLFFPLFCIDTNSRNIITNNTLNFSFEVLYNEPNNGVLQGVNTLEGISSVISQLSPYIKMMYFTTRPLTYNTNYGTSYDWTLDFQYMSTRSWFALGYQNYTSNVCFSDIDSYISTEYKSEITVSYIYNYKTNVLDRSNKNENEQSKYEMNVNCYPYKYYALATPNGDYPIIPYRYEKNLNIIEKNMGMGIMFKVPHWGETKKFDYGEITGYVPLKTDFYNALVSSSRNSLIAQGVNNFINLGLGVGETIAKKDASVLRPIENYALYFAKLADAEKTPDSLSNVSIFSINNFEINDDIYLVEYDIDEHERFEIFKFLKRYGISYERIGKINNFTHTNFDYVETANCSLPYIKDSIDRKKLESIYDGGVRRWHLSGYEDAILNFDMEYANICIS